MTDFARDAELRRHWKLPGRGEMSVHDLIEAAVSSRRHKKLTELWRFNIKSSDGRDADQLRFGLVSQLVRQLELGVGDTVWAVSHWNDHFAEQIAAKRTNSHGAFTPTELGALVRKEHAKVLTQKMRDEAALAEGEHDTANAERLVELHGDDVRYVVDEGIYRVFDGRAWTADDKRSTHVLGLTADVGRELEASCGGVSKEAARDLKKHVKRALSAEGRTAILSLARADSRVRVWLEAFDRNPDLLTAKNCTVNLRTGETWGHRRGDMLTHWLPVEFDPAAKGPTWNRFVAEILPDPGVRRYVQKLLGYAATGHVGERKIFVLLGQLGREGKSTLIGAVSRLLGPYAIPTPPELLLRGQNKKLDEKKSKLRGVRLAHGSDLTSEGAHWDGPLVKELTGGDEITARDVYRTRIRFRPSHTFVIGANRFPGVQAADADTAFWDRAIVVPFENRVEKPNLELGTLLDSESARILAWLVEGARAWYDEGLEPPQAVVDATIEARLRSDPLLQFLQDHLRPSPGKRLRAKTLWRAYELASSPGGFGAKVFPDAVRARGYTRGKDVHGKYWEGVELVGEGSK